MIEIRQIEQSKTKGHIFLHSMPGRCEDLDALTDALLWDKVTTIVCLTEESEIKEKSPCYLTAVRSRDLSGIRIIYSPVTDYGIPPDKEFLVIFGSALDQARLQLESGNILIHCGAGVGRTGTFAAILLRLIGFSHDNARRITADAGSEPETDEQKKFCREYPF